MKEPSTVKTWQKTRLQNLIRHKSGGYYARAFADGKEIWKSLKTSHFSVAKAKLADFLKEQRERRRTLDSARNGKMTIADALAIHMQKIADNVSAKRTKRTTEHYWKQIYAALAKSWPDLASRNIRRITTAESYADRPTWSPAPFNEIAFAARTGPGYDIKVYDLASGQTRQITFGEGTNESPAYSPNGRHVAFTSTRNGRVQVFTIARDGKDVKQITRDGNNFTPAWSN